MKLTPKGKQAWRGIWLMTLLNQLVWLVYGAPVVAAWLGVLAGVRRIDTGLWIMTAWGGGAVLLVVCVQVAFMCRFERELE